MLKEIKLKIIISDSGMKFHGAFDLADIDRHISMCNKLTSLPVGL
jgi:hypothetical protein